MKKELLKKSSVLVIACICWLGLTGCTDGQRKDIAALGNQHRVEMYSGGTKVREWTSTGYVESSSKSDGYFFTDAKTHKLIKISGDIVITMLD